MPPLKKVSVKVIKIFFRSGESTSSAAVILIISLFLTNLLGLIKLRVYSSVFQGASNDLGIFLASDRIPNFVFNVLVIGALTTAFIPIFSQNIAQGKRDKAFELASTLFNLSFVVFSFVAVIFFIFSRDVLGAFSWGVDLSAGESELLNISFRILFFAQLFFLFSAFSSGILQSFGNFTAVAASPVIFNIVVIAFTVILAPRFGILGASLATVLGAISHFLVQVPALLSVGFSYKPIVNLKDRLLKEVGVLVVPRTFSLMIDQLAALLLTSLSLSLSASSVVIFSFAQRLELIPVVLFGSAFAQASFAPLSKSAQGNSLEFISIFKRTFSYLSFLILPASVLLIVLRIPLVRIFFGSRGFDWPATVLTAHTLSFFAVGIFFQAHSGLLARAFFALKSTRVPLVSSLIALVFGSALAIVSTRLWHWNVWGLALSASVIDLIDFLILYLLLSRKFPEILSATFLRPIFLMAVSAVISGFVSFFIVRQLDSRFYFFDTRYFTNLLGLTLLSLALGGFTYLLISYKLGINEGRKVILWISRIRNFGPAFLSGLLQE